MPDHSADRDEMIETAIQRALDTLTPKGAAVVSRVALEHQLRAVAHEAATVAADMARMDLMTAEAVATELGISRQRVWALARSRELGWQVGRAWVFTPQDVDAMRDRAPGRPAQE